MGYILKTKTLEHNGRVIGIIGMDMESGETKYYTFLDNHCNYDEDNFHLVDFNSMPNCMLKCWLKNFKRFNNRENLPDYLRDVLDEYLKKHRDYNLQNGFPVDAIDFNFSNLETKYFNIPDTRLTFVCHGDYYSPINSIELVSNRKSEEIASNQRVLEENVLTHELGHLKVARNILDKEVRRLNCSVGFRKFTYKLIPICMVGDDLIYIGEKIVKKPYFNALEETFNEYECSFIKKDYVCCYPFYAPILMDISNGTLLKARHENDGDEYFKVMTSIIDDENMARKTLEMMYLGLDLGSSVEQGKAFQLLKKYQKAKNRKGK